MDVKWELLQEIECFETDEFWYDLTQGGYLKPEKILANPQQIEALQEAIDIVRSFEDMIERLQ